MPCFLLKRGNFRGYIIINRIGSPVYARILDFTFIYRLVKQQKKLPEIQGAFLLFQIEFRKFANTQDRVACFENIFTNNKKHMQVN